MDFKTVDIGADLKRWSPVQSFYKLDTVLALLSAVSGSLLVAGAPFLLCTFDVSFVLPAHRACVGMLLFDVLVDLPYAAPPGEA